ncbi:MAG: hypothetical protein ABH896_03865 [Candidatus Jacksonbacteria bacterium]
MLKNTFKNKIPACEVSDLTGRFDAILANSPVYITAKNQKKIAILLEINKWRDIQRFLWEIQDTDEAIQIAKTEAAAGKIKTAKSFKEILNDAESNAD